MADTSLVFSILAKDKASKTLSAIKVAAAAAFAAGATAAVAFGKSAIDAAANLAETQSKVGVLFGSSAGAIESFAATAAKSLGQSKQSAMDAAATFAVFGKSAGLSGDKLVGFSTEMTTLASDLASFNNTSPEQAIEAIGAALRGESEPIRQYGVLLDDATLRNRALKLGLISTTSQALTPQQKVLAAQAEILAQTTAAQGDFARTSGGLANQQRIMKAQLANVTAELGTKLLPAATKVTTWAVGAVDWMKQHEGLVKTLVVVLGSFAVIIGTIIGVTKVWTVVQTALNVVMALNPIGLVILAVVALIATIVLIATKTTWFQTIWNTVWGGIKAAAQAVGSWFAGPFAGFFVGLWNGIVSGVVGTKNWIVNTFNTVVGFVASIPGRIRSAASGMWDGIKDAFRVAINWIIGRWNNLSFTIPSANIPGLGKVGGGTLSTPDIPYLDVGGSITRTGLAVVHRGEQVTPARSNPLSGGRSGPVVIELRGADDEFKRFFRAILRKNPNLLVAG